MSPPDPPRGRGRSPEDTGCTVLHVEVDAFVASVELLRHPELVGTPVIVGGGSRGVVLSATEEARRSGVRAAMPMSRARRLCPAATVLAPHHEDHVRVSEGVLAVLRSITPLVEPLGPGEAFLDVSGALRRLGPPARIGQQVRDRVADEQGVTCSVGVASTPLVAELASGAVEPDGLLVVPHAETVAFLHALPVSALRGVGERTGEVLARLGLHAVADLAHTPVSTLERALGGVSGRHLHDLAWGRDGRRVVAAAPERSIASSETFVRDVDDPRVVHRELLRLAGRTAARARAAGVAARTVVLQVRFADSTTITRSRTLREATDVTREVHAGARDLFDALGLDRARLRLVGIRLEGLVDASTRPRQLVLGERARGWRDADDAVDRASARFGAGSVRPATLLPAPGPGPGPGAPLAGGAGPASSCGGTLPPLSSVAAAGGPVPAPARRNGLWWGTMW